MTELKNPKYKIEKTGGIPFTAGPVHSYRVNSERKVKKTNNLEIGVCCRTQKEFLIIITLITHIQHYYRKKFTKAKRISFRKLVEYTLKEIEAKGDGFYPFPEKEQK